MSQLVFTYGNIWDWGFSLEHELCTKASDDYEDCILVEHTDLIRLVNYLGQETLKSSLESGVEAFKSLKTSGKSLKGEDKKEFIKEQFSSWTFTIESDKNPLNTLDYILCEVFAQERGADVYTPPSYDKYLDLLANRLCQFESSLEKYQIDRETEKEFCRDLYHYLAAGYRSGVETTAGLTSFQNRMKKFTSKDVNLRIENPEAVNPLIKGSALFLILEIGGQKRRLTCSPYGSPFHFAQWV
ncbi:MAG: hypothetical protein CMO81_00640 [Waddliaceae bacterium]|nr:hypothetical protein [Waddliaceae bacterium]